LSTVQSREKLFLQFALLNAVSALVARAADLKFPCVPFSPGSTVCANVPLTAEENSYASQGGNAVP
jgi:hypothetical protein